MEFEELTFSDYVVTCETEGCDNSGIDIAMSAPSVDASFACGVCFNPITKIKQAK